MKEKSVSQLRGVTCELPKIVRILFRSHALVFLIYTMAAGIQLIYSISTNGKDLLDPIIVATFSVSDGVAIVIAFYVFVLSILILEVIYSIGIYKFKRWALPLVLTFSFSTLLVGFLSLLNQNLTGVIELLGLLIAMVFMGYIGYASIKYWGVFTGSARKLLIQIPLLLAFFPIILFATLSQIFIDDVQIKDSDIILQPVKVLPEYNNAYYYLPNIDNFSVQEQQAYKTALKYARTSEGNKPSNQEALSLINQTRGLTDDFIKASTRNSYQCPTLTNDYSIDAVFCDFGFLRDLANLTSFRSAVELGTGSTDQAIISAISIIRLGRMVYNAEQPTMIEHFLGLSLILNGLESLERIVDSSVSISNQSIMFAISELEQINATDTAYINSLKREYMAIKDTSNSFKQFSNYFYQHNKTVNQQAKVIRMKISISSQSCDADTFQKQQEVRQLVDEIRLSPYKWPIISPNFFGKILNSVLVNSAGTTSQKGCELNLFNEQVLEKMKEKSKENSLNI